MILVTSAAGIVGHSLLRRLISRGHSVRAFVKNEAQASALRAEGSVEIMTGDLQNPADIQQSIDGVDQIYFAAPTRIVKEVPMVEYLIEACRSQSPKQIIYHSVIHPEIKQLPHHGEKLIAEGCFIDSGLPVTILRPSHYMQNYLEAWDFLRLGVFPFPISAESRMGVVDIEDVSEAAVKIIENPGSHIGKTYDLSAVELNRNEMARICSRVFASEIKAIRIPPATINNPTLVLGEIGNIVKSLAKPKFFSLMKLIPILLRSRNPRGMRDWPEDARNCYHAMLEYYDMCGLPAGDLSHLPALLGRKPTDFEGFIQREKALRKGGCS
ncbi:MAG: NmrA family NAD(P)-binding protein [Proteobacteria bacterium]|nr:NmrA family NAD(P)-binding protein [Pseudomonadota bacterium]